MKGVLLDVVPRAVALLYIAWSVPFRYVFVEEFHFGPSYLKWWILDYTFDFVLVALWVVADPSLVGARIVVLPDHVQSLLKRKSLVPQHRTAASRFCGASASVSKKRMATARNALFQVLATAPIELLALSLGPKRRSLAVFKLNRLLRLVDAPRCAKVIFAIVEDSLRVSGGFLRIWLTFLTMGVAAHWGACLFYLAAKVDARPSRAFARQRADTTWAQTDTLWTVDAEGKVHYERTVKHRYFRAFYWAMNTMCTTGFGDINPVTRLETVCSIVCMYVGMSIACCGIGNLTLLFTVQNSSNVAHDQRLVAVRTYVSYRNLPESVAMRMVGYVEWASRSKFNQDKFLGELPMTLRNAVLKVRIVQLLRRLPCLSYELARDALVNALANKLVTATYGPHDDVVRPGEILDGALVISHGELDVRTRTIIDDHFGGTMARGFERSQKNLIVEAEKAHSHTRLRRGDHFGAKSLFHPVQCRVIVQAHSFCQVLWLLRGMFQAVVAEQCKADQIEDMYTAVVRPNGGRTRDRWNLKHCSSVVAQDYASLSERQAEHARSLRGQASKLASRFLNKVPSKFNLTARFSMVKTLPSVTAETMVAPSLASVLANLGAEVAPQGGPESESESSEDSDDDDDDDDDENSDADNKGGRKKVLKERSRAQEDRREAAHKARVLRAHKAQAELDKLFDDSDSSDDDSIREEAEFRTHYPFLMPDAEVRECLEVVICAGLYFYAVFIPIALKTVYTETFAFGDGRVSAKELSFFLGYGVDFVFFVEAVLRLTILPQYDERGVLLTQGDDLRHLHFRKSRFFTFEVLACLPWDLIALLPRFRRRNRLSVYALARIAKVPLVLLRVNEQTDIIGSYVIGVCSKQFMRIIKTNCLLLLLTHYVGVGFIIAARVTQHKHGHMEKTWIYADRWFDADRTVSSLARTAAATRADVRAHFDRTTNVFECDQEWSIPYCTHLRAIYFGMLAMSTLGYGDIIPTMDNLIETFYVTCVCLIGGMFLPAMVGGLASLIADLEPAYREYKNKSFELRAAMRRHKLHPQLQNALLKYHNYVWTRHKGADERSVLIDLPKPLRRSALVEAVGPAFASAPFLSRACGVEEFARQELVSRLEPRVFLPGDVVLAEGDLSRLSLFFIERGGVDQFAAKAGSNKVAAMRRDFLRELERQTAIIDRGGRPAILGIDDSDDDHNHDTADHEPPSPTRRLPKRLPAAVTENPIATDELIRRCSRRERGKLIVRMTREEVQYPLGRPVDQPGGGHVGRRGSSSLSLGLVQGFRQVRLGMRDSMRNLRIRRTSNLDCGDGGAEPLTPPGDNNDGAAALTTPTASSGHVGAVSSRFFASSPVAPAQGQSTHRPIINPRSLPSAQALVKRPSLHPLESLGEINADDGDHEHQTDAPLLRQTPRGGGNSIHGAGPVSDSPNNNVTLSDDQESKGDEADDEADVVPSLARAAAAKRGAPPTASASSSSLSLAALAQQNNNNINNNNNNNNYYYNNSSSPPAMASLSALAQQQPPPAFSSGAALAPEEHHHHPPPPSFAIVGQQNPSLQALALHEQRQQQQAPRGSGNRKEGLRNSLRIMGGTLGRRTTKVARAGLRDSARVLTVGLRGSRGSASRRASVKQQRNGLRDSIRNDVQQAAMRQPLPSCFCTPVTRRNAGDFFGAECLLDMPPRSSRNNLKKRASAVASSPPKTKTTHPPRSSSSTKRGSPGKKTAGSPGTSMMMTTTSKRLVATVVEVQPARRGSISVTANRRQSQEALAESMAPQAQCEPRVSSICRSYADCFELSRDDYFDVIQGFPTSGVAVRRELRVYCACEASTVETTLTHLAESYFCVAEAAKRDLEVDKDMGIISPTDLEAYALSMRPETLSSVVSKSTVALKYHQAHSRMANSLALRHRSSNSMKHSGAAGARPTFSRAGRVAPGSAASTPSSAARNSSVRSAAERAVAATDSTSARIRALNLAMCATFGDPESPGQIAWAAVMLVVVIYHATSTPLHCAFLTKNLSWYAVDWFLDAVNVVDALFSALLFGTMHHGQLVLDPKAIFNLRRASGRIHFDVLFCFPYDIFAVGAPQARRPFALALLRVPKLFRVVRIPRYVDIARPLLESLEARLFNKRFAAIVRLIGAILLISHWFACGWFAVARWKWFDRHSDPPLHERWRCTWVRRQIVDFDLPLETGFVSMKDAVEQYLRALNWALPTLVAVCIGDVRPMTCAETLYCYVAMAFGMSVNATVIGSIVEALHDSSSSGELAARADRLESYMHKHLVPLSLRIRVNEYTAALQSASVNAEFLTGVPNEKHASLLHSTLPHTLRMRVCVAIRLPVIEKCPLFEPCDEVLRTLIALVLVPEMYSAGDIVTQHGEIGDDMHFLLSGIVTVLGANNSTVYATLTAGSFFGEGALFENVRRAATIKCVGFTETLRLNRDDLTAQLKAYRFKTRLLLEKFHSMRDRNARHNTAIQHGLKTATEAGSRLSKVMDVDETSQALSGISLSALAHDPVLASGPGARPHKRNSNLTFDTTRRQSLGERAGGAYFLVLDRLATAFHQGTHGRAAWDTFDLLMTLYLAIVVPFSATFVREHRLRHLVAWSSASMWFEWLAGDVLFGLVMVVRLQMPSLDVPDVEKELSSAKWRTAGDLTGDAYYRSRDFLCDLASVVPLEILALAGLGTETSNHTRNVVLVLRFNRLIRLSRLPRVADSLQQYARLNHGLRVSVAEKEVAMVGVFYLLANHWLACGWFVIHRYVERDSRATWATQDAVAVRRDVDLHPHENHLHVARINSLDCYLRAAHFVIAVISSTGNGDIKPQTPLETVYQLCVVVCGAVMLAWLISAFTVLLAAFDTEGLSAFNAKVHRYEAFMKHAKLPLDLRDRVVAHHRHRWSKLLCVDEHAITNDLTGPLRMDLALFVHRRAFERIKVFAMLPESITRRMAAACTTQVAEPDEAIYEAGDVGFEVYFVYEGECLVVPTDASSASASDRHHHRSSKDPKQLVREGDHFGERAMRSKSGIRHETVTALVKCELYSIAADDIEEEVRKLLTRNRKRR